jgi:hypothetical protein
VLVVIANVQIATETTAGHPPAQDEADKACGGSRFDWQPVLLMTSSHLLRSKQKGVRLLLVQSASGVLFEIFEFIRLPGERLAALQTVKQSPIRLRRHRNHREIASGEFNQYRCVRETLRNA